MTELNLPLTLPLHSEVQWKAGRGTQILLHSCQTPQRMDTQECRPCKIIETSLNVNYRSEVQYTALTIVPHHTEEKVFYTYTVSLTHPKPTSIYHLQAKKKIQCTILPVALTALVEILLKSTIISFIYNNTF